MLEERCEINKAMLYKKCIFLAYYAANSCSFLSTFRDNLSVTFSRIKNKKFLAFKDETNMLSRNVDKKLPLLAA